MARNVDWANPDNVTDDDLRWAVEWELWRQISEAGFDVDEVRERYGAGAPSGEGDPYNTAGVPKGGSESAARINSRTGRPETLTEESSAASDPEDAPYGEWHVDELRAELKARQLPGDGKKADLVARLEEDDATKPEE